MKILHIDIETYSDIDLLSCGLYKYVESSNFEILLLAYSFGSEVHVIDLAQKEVVPLELIAALTDPNVIKVAHNAAFEMVCLDKYLSGASVIGPKFRAIDPSQWRCTMVMGYHLGLPGSLDNAAKALKLSREKMAGGKSLINYFSKPCRPTKTNANRTRNLPAHDPDKWQLFKDYNAQDVQVEMLIYDLLKQYELPAREWDLWALDQKINMRGVVLDEIFIKGALKCDRESTMVLTNEALSLTGLDNPNSPTQLKAWIEKEEGIEVPSIAKSVIDSLNVKSPKVKRMLELRQMMSKTSTAKYVTMDSAMCLDGRARGLLQFYGASKTGRWAGRLIQVQNLPRNYLKDLDDAREIVKSGNYSLLELLYGDVPDTLSQLIRTAFVSSEGRKLIVVDFSAIEARVIAWLADESWRNEVFASHGKIYEMSASQMFNIPLNEITPELRQKGKVAELACIAEGELVLTDKGLVPIELVSISDKVWDGLNFVEHEGVVFKGLKEVIEYGGLKATKDHKVWIEGEREPVEFGVAAASKKNLLRSGVGGRPIWLDRNYQPRKKVQKRKLERLYGIRTVCGMFKNLVVLFSQSIKRAFKRVSVLLTTETSPKMAVQEIYGGETALSTKVYDILNAGPLNRYTVSGVLVHNCGYQGSTGALIQMGALDMGLAEHELQGLVDAWRNANSNITNLWSEVQSKIQETITTGLTTYLNHGVSISKHQSVLAINLPSGRSLYYLNARLDGWRIYYDGVGTNNKWEKINTYGGKLVENIVQAIARDCLAEALVRVDNRGWETVMHIHDEIVIDAPLDLTVEDVVKAITEPISWAKGLKLNADGFEADYYQKD